MTESAGLPCCSEIAKDEVPVLFGPKNAGLVTRARRCFGPAINLFAALQTVNTGTVTTGPMGRGGANAS